MKKMFTTVVGALVLIGATALITTRLTTHPVPPLPSDSTSQQVPVLAYDSSPGGNSTGGHPLVFFNPVHLIAGSALIIQCARGDCPGIRSSADRGAAAGNSNILFELKIPDDLPANTQMSLSFRPAPGAK